MIAFLDSRQAADPRSNQYAHTTPIFVGDFCARILHRLNGSRHSVMDEGIHFSRFFGSDVLGDIKVDDRPAEAGAKVRNIEGRNRPNATFTGNGITPRFFC